MTKLQQFLEMQMGRSCNLERAQEEYRVDEDHDEICDRCGQQPVRCECVAFVIIPWSASFYPMSMDSQCLTLR